MVISSLGLFNLSYAALESALLSNYVSEGRAQLEEGGILQINWEKAFQGGWGVGGEHIRSISDDYGEWVASGSKGFQWNSVEIAVGIQYLYVVPDDEDDWESFLDTNWALGGGFSWSNAFYYSDTTSGFFIESGVGWEGNWPHPELLLRLEAHLGWEAGYSNILHEGINHAGFLAGLSKTVTDGFEVGCWLEYYHPLDVLDDIKAGEEWLVGVNCVVGF